ncbi:MetQ/NlpA family ABC transporter substrate-binding protein [Clostridium cellulovorans]|uniref:Lipoprotein n=1 Tax=Clostridium cellulovorans (strain ATCC 35296 / DSM 3052 / OCM 3 / 743B) TaxID=573061 RepID=D9SRE6_CLOC7|nr:MetQ/NlpA family ABC transporter substrate-binding protein [Clostridium cellulovorans]ADL52375.1 NLPA lipoprotein [Clostridium cellulovorans 743B]
MKKWKTLLTAGLLAVSLTACGTGTSKGEKATENKNDKTITVGASANPHALILEKVKPILEKEGYTLEIQIFDDYVLPNTALDGGELDANFFQHEPYLNDFNKKKGTDLVAVQKVHIEPLGIYSKNLKDLKDLKEGVEITIPLDSSNGSRALKLLAKAGLFEVPDKETVSVADITKNTKNFKISEVEAKQLSKTLPDVALSVINSNYALEAGLNPVKDSLFIENSDSPYANIIVVKKGHENDEKIKALNKAITSEEIKKYINDEFKGAVVPAF